MAMRVRESSSCGKPSTRSLIDGLAVAVLDGRHKSLDERTIEMEMAGDDDRRFGGSRLGGSCGSC